MAKLGSISTTRRKNGLAAALAPEARPTFMAVLYAFRASSEDVVTSTSGVECFSTVASDSPSRGLSLRTISLRAVQDVLSPRRLDLLLVENASGVAVPGAQAQDILAPKAGDRAFQHCGAGGPLTDLLRDLRGQPRIFRLSHQRQRLLDLLIRNQAEERRLLKLHGQPLAQRVVKHRIAGLVLKVREDDGVLVREFRCAVNIEVRGAGAARAGPRQQERSPSSALRQSSSGRSSVCAPDVRPESVSRFRRCRSVRMSGSVLVAQVAIFFEALVDDALQFGRHIGIQTHCGAPERD